MGRRARTYRRVEVDVWQSRDFRGLSSAKPNAQTLWLWLLTSERTTIVPGLVLSRPAVMADDLRWPRRGFDAALAELESAGMIEVDRDAGIVLLARALLVDGKVRDGASPTSINAAKSWATTLLKLPSSPLRDVVLARAEVAVAECEDKIRNAFADAMSLACARQDACRADGVRTQGTGNREQVDPEHTHTRAGGEPLEATGAHDPQPLTDRSRDVVTEAAEKLYERHAAYLRKLAPTIPGCPEPIVGGMAPANTLVAIRDVVLQWRGQAAAAGLDPDDHVESQMLKLVAVRTAKARKAGHVGWWASKTFWNLDGIERDLLQSPEQASGATKSVDQRPSAPRGARADADSRLGEQLDRVERLRAQEAADAAAREP